LVGDRLLGVEIGFERAAFELIENVALLDVGPVLEI